MLLHNEMAPVKFSIVSRMSYLLQWSHFVFSDTEDMPAMIRNQLLQWGRRCSAAKGVLCRNEQVRYELSKLDPLDGTPVWGSSFAA